MVTICLRCRIRPLTVMQSRSVAFRPAGGADEVHSASTQETPSADVQGTVADYSPLDTLKPTSWTPIRRDRQRSGSSRRRHHRFDVLGYHGYAATATWLVSGPDGAPTPSAATPDWQLSYVYNRWRPAFYRRGVERDVVLRRPGDGRWCADRRDATRTAGRRRIDRPRSATRACSTWHAWPRSAPLPTTRWAAARSRGIARRFALSWETLTARTYGYSISRGGRRRGRRDDRDRSARARIVCRRDHHNRRCARLPAGSCAASRRCRSGSAAARRSATPRSAARSCSAAILPAMASSISAATPSRCCAASRRTRFAGSRVAIANAGVPLADCTAAARPRHMAAVSAHAARGAFSPTPGNAWTRAFDRGAIKTSAGAQLSANLVAGFFAPFTVSVGAAWGHDGSGLVADRVTAYFRVGKGF